MELNTHKKIAMVTGAAGNLGQAAAKKFIDEGYKVIGTARLSDNLKMDIETHEVDLMNEEAAQKFVENIIEKYGKIDAAILTVGGFAVNDIAGTKTSGITRQYKLNFETAYNIARPVFAQMIKQQSGRIFMIGSKPGLSPANSKGMIAYSLSKSLIFRLAELMNDEAKGINVVTNVVVPSTIDTPQNRQSMPDADFSKWVSPEKIAGIMYYYCTEEAALLREPVIKVYGNG